MERSEEWLIRTMSSEFHDRGGRRAWLWGPRGDEAGGPLRSTPVRATRRGAPRVERLREVRRRERYGPMDILEGATGNRAVHPLYNGNSSRVVFRIDGKQFYLVG